MLKLCLLCLLGNSLLDLGHYLLFLNRELSLCLSHLLKKWYIVLPLGFEDFLRYCLLLSRKLAHNQLDVLSCQLRGLVGLLLWLWLRLLLLNAWGELLGVSSTSLGMALEVVHVRLLLLWRPQTTTKATVVIRRTMALEVVGLVPVLSLPRWWTTKLIP
jgi:hypothetical protein